MHLFAFVISRSASEGYIQCVYIAVNKMRFGESLTFNSIFNKSFDKLRRKDNCIYSSKICAIDKSFDEFAILISVSKKSSNKNVIRPF